MGEANLYSGASPRAASPVIPRPRQAPIGGNYKPPSSARSSRDPRQYARWGQGPKWSIDEAFGDVFRRASDEGVNVFAVAPEASYRQTATTTAPNAPKLQAPHMKSSGLVKEESDVTRLDGCLTRDFFQRPAWNRSTLPKRQPEDLRSLETMSRNLRHEAMESSLRHDDAGRTSVIAADHGVTTPLEQGILQSVKRASIRKSVTENLRPATTSGSARASISGGSARASIRGGSARGSLQRGSLQPLQAGSELERSATTPRGQTFSM